jgi:hypothetical protein
MGMKIIKLTFVLCFLFCLSCKTSQKTASAAKKATRPVACAGLAITSIHFDWIIEKDDALSGYTERPLPKEYKVYSIDSTQLAAFFNYAQEHPNDSGLQISVPLPDPQGCRVFDVPNIKVRPGKDNTFMTGLTGTDAEIKENTIKMNFDGQQIHASVNWFSMLYVVLPVVYNTKIYYLLYSRASAPPTSTRPAKNSAIPNVYKPMFNK